MRLKQRHLFGSIFKGLSGCLFQGAAPTKRNQLFFPTIGQKVKQVRKGELLTQTYLKVGKFQWNTNGSWCDQNFTTLYLYKSK